MKNVLRVLALLLVGLTGAAAVPAGATHPPPTPTLVAVRAAHHPGFDRIVYEFRGGLPADVRVGYVDELLGDFSGLPVRIAGRAILRVSLEPARAHDSRGRVTAPARRSFALPNIMTTVRAGDFEAVTTYGIGLARRTRFHAFTMRDPDRVVIDVGARFRTVERPVWFFDRRAFVDNTPPFYTARMRPVRPRTPATGVMDRLFAGPTRSEGASGLVLLRSGATGFSRLSVAQGVARVRLSGGCSSGGSTESIAGEITPTLRALPGVDWVKILDPSGSTETPLGRSDSVPVCLEP